MVYSTARCPSCGKVINEQRNPSYRVGNPFRQCPFCGKPYLDHYTEEWITKSPFKRFFFFIQAGVWSRAFIVPLLIVALVDIVWLWPLLSIAWLICGYFVHKKDEEKSILQSIERTQNPEYLILLEKVGYKIYPLKSHDTDNLP
ncbi:MAG: hypothetical protein J6K12_05755 [Clostridia bacterium]|nr:hypothetical protein [Clostridia bacterium]